MNSSGTAAKSLVGIVFLMCVLAASAHAGNQGAARAPDPAAKTTAETGGRQVVIAGTDAAGPDWLDKVFLRQYGPKSAGTILVLIPGSAGGQGNFAALAPALVARVPDLAVWAIDRRGNALEDAYGFNFNPETALGYYLFGESVYSGFNGRTFKAVTPKKGSYVSQWGANVAIRDLHKVVGKARAGGKRKVILGGHSNGAVTTPVYAVWDFAGRPGYRDLSGLLMIDGMELGAFNSYVSYEGSTYSGFWRTEDDARRGLKAAKLKEYPFGVSGFESDSQNGGNLWVQGVLLELVCKYALEEPGEESVLQEIEQIEQFFFGSGASPGLPTFQITNEAFAGLAFTSTSTAEQRFRVSEIRTGSLADEGNPRPWVNGRYTSVSRVCRTFTQQPGNGSEWYYPSRLDRDLLQALGSLRPTAATRYLKMRPFHLASVNTPTFVFETGLTRGAVLRAAKLFIKRTKVREYVFASDQNMGHLEPLVDYPANNKFIQRVVPWLRGIAAR